MSTKRRQPAVRVNNPNGKGYLCSCGCGRKPQGRRLYWYSEECVNEWKIKNQPAYVRELLLERDHGICACCGRDTLKLRRQFHGIRAEATQHTWRKLPARHRGDYFRPVRHLDRWHEASRFPGTNRSWWDADHIVEVVNGGGQCGLENYQTLCVPCHKDKTARLARELAEARKKNDGNLELELELGC